MGLYIPYMGLFQWQLTIIIGILGHSCSDTAQLYNPWVNEPLGSSSSLLYLYVYYVGHMRLPWQNWANCLLFIVYRLVVWNMTNMTFIFHNRCHSPPWWTHIFQDSYCTTSQFTTLGFPHCLWFAGDLMQNLTSLRYLGIWPSYKAKPAHSHQPVIRAQTKNPSTYIICNM